MNPVVFLVLLSFCLLVFRYHMPIAKRPQGHPLRTINVSMPARVRLQRPNVYGVGALMALGAIGGWLPFGALLLLALGVMGVLLLPLSYQLTDVEIALGRSRPRAWSEFQSIEQEPRRLVLKSDDGRTFTVWLPGGTTDAAILADVRQLVRPAAGSGKEMTARLARKPGRGRSAPRVV